MQTRLADFIRDTPEGQEAEAILRKCVHCGFCTATCPTYQVLGDDLDSPRGRIYLMKRALEGAPVTDKTRLHLDRCLTCRACETTCPSGVRYGRLVDIGRAVVESKTRRGPLERMKSRARLWLAATAALRSRACARPRGAAAPSDRIETPAHPQGRRMARRAPCAKDAGACRMRAAGHRAFH
jgi:glycolate oxidase iron-sulfur subunit